MAAIYVTSPLPAEGKTTLCVGLARHLGQKGKRVGYMKPVRLTPPDEEPAPADGDAAFVGEILGLSAEVSQLAPLAFSEPGLVKETAQGRALGERVRGTFQKLAEEADVMLLEGVSGNQAAQSAATQISVAVDARVVLVCGCSVSLEEVKRAAAPHRERLLGVVLNQVPGERLGFVRQSMAAALERDGLPVLAVIPEDPVLRAAPIRALARSLGAEVLNSEERTGELVESIQVGPVFSDKVDEYFQRRGNKVVVTRGDRPDLQLAALKSSIRCLLLTEGLPPLVYIAYQAQDRGLPILVAPQDTASALDALGESWGEIRFRQPQKVGRIEELLSRHADLAPVEAWLAS